MRSAYSRASRVRRSRTARAKERRGGLGRGGGELDLAIVSSAGGLAPPEGVTLEPLMDDVHLVALPRSHPLATKEDLTLADLRDETWIEGRPSECTNALLAATERAGFEPRIAFEAAQWLGKQGLVAAGVGVTLIPSVALATVRDDIVMRSLGPDAPTRCISLARQAAGYAPGVVAPMAALLHRVATEHCFSCDAMVDTPLMPAAVA